MSNVRTLVVGGGAAGLFTALALQHSNIEVALVAPSPLPDYRTTALMQPAIQGLKNLGVFESLSPHFAPLKAMRLIDATGALFKSPELLFEASELELEAFGYNIENRLLTDILKSAFKGKIYASPVFDYQPGQVTLDTGEVLTTDFIAAADGRNSFIREKAGILTTLKTLPQTAFVCSFSHTLPHHDTSTEFHTREGPMTFVPMKGNMSSLVWVMKDKTALENMDLGHEISKRANHLFGKITLNEHQAFFPLTSLSATKITAEKLALIGEAAHVMPPIGAQGLNLSFRDGAFFAECLQSKDTLSTYEKSRLLDVQSRTLAVNSLNHSLLSSLMPVHAARAFGMSMIEKIPALRGFVMKQGIAPNNLPKLMT